MPTNREIFDSIAESWYGFRHHSRFKTELDELCARWKGGRLLNVGCGHGADFVPFKSGFELHGLDFSSGMIKQAERYSAKFGFQLNAVVSDAGFLPYKNDSFDHAIAVAVYHHLRGKLEQETALKELYRILKPGSEAFITVWNKWQPGFWFRSKDTYVPWRTKGETYDRYYHLFSYYEFKRLIKKAGFRILVVKPESSFKFPLKYFSKNICVLVRKP
jgi:tRNA (uracil-5-)-methyltransferase TRM9